MLVLSERELCLSEFRVHPMLWVTEEGTALSLAAQEFMGFALGPHETGGSWLGIWIFVKMPWCCTQPELSTTRA